MITNDQIATVAAHARETLGPGPYEPMPGWTHIGAIVCDTALQSGIDYDKVVLPKIQRLIDLWPDAKTTSGFMHRLENDDLEAALEFRGQKLDRIRAIAALFQSHEIETVDDLAATLTDPSFLGALRQVKGVGDKSVDYMRELAGLPSVAIDRHLMTFLANAGVHAGSYQEAQELLIAVADRLEENPGGLDHSIWNFMSGESTPGTS